MLAIHTWPLFTNTSLSSQGHREFTQIAEVTSYRCFYQHQHRVLYLPIYILYLQMLQMQHAFRKALFAIAHALHLLPLH